MAQTHASLAEPCGSWKKGNESAENDSDTASPLGFRMGGNFATVKPSTVHLMSLPVCNETEIEKN